MSRRMPWEQYLQRAEHAEAEAGRAQDEVERRSYVEIAQIWRALAERRRASVLRLSGLTARRA